MLVIALVLAVIGLAALVFAVVTSNALVAWVCIGASLLGVLLLIVDALRERRAHTATSAAPTDADDAGAPTDEGADDAVDEARPEAAPESDDVADFDAEATDETAVDPAPHRVD